MTSITESALFVAPASRRCFCAGSEVHQTTGGTPALQNHARSSQLGARRSVLKRNGIFILCQPHLEALQGRVQAPGEARPAHPAKVIFEIALELKHVAYIVGAGETEPAVYVRWHAVVADFLSQHLGKNGGHLRARQILTRNSDGLANELITLLEYAIGAFAYVLGGDARKLFVAHRQRDGQLSVRTFFRTHAEVNKVVPIE